MLRAGHRCRNSGDGMADLSGGAAAPVLQKRQGVGWFWGGQEEAGRIQNDQPEEPDEKIMPQKWNPWYERDF